MKCILLLSKLRRAGKGERKRTNRERGSSVFIQTANALWRDLMLMFNVTLICIVINAQSDCSFQVCMIQMVPHLTSGPGCINRVFAQTPCVLLSPTSTCPKVSMSGENVPHSSVTQSGCTCSRRQLRIRWRHGGRASERNTVGSACTSSYTDLPYLHCNHSFPLTKTLSIVI